MAGILYSIEDGVVIFRIPVDPLTAERLISLAKSCESDPVKTAASLLHDVLADDAAAHETSPEP